MKPATGTVIDGKVIVEGDPLREGSVDPVVRPPVELPRDLLPLGAHVLVQIEQLHVVLASPLVLGQVGVQVVVPPR